MMDRHQSMSFDERIVNGMGVLAAIVHSGSFASAAAALDLSPSGVSRAVARLEARLGVRLFDRTTRSVVLSDEGRRFYEQVAPLLASLEEAAASAARGGTIVRGRLRVNIDPFLSRLLLAPQLGAFVDRYPDLQLELIARDELGDMVADGYDLAVRFGYPPVSSLIARKLSETRIVTAASPAYLKRRGRPVKPADLASGHHPCIQYRDPTTGRPFVWEFHRGRKRITVDTPMRLIVNDVGTVHGLCLGGHGIAQVMELGLEHAFADGRLVDLFPDWPDERFPLHALYPSRRFVPAKTRAFIEFVAALLP
jgi:DNA-binding transcriptional LysR family regulator